MASAQAFLWQICYIYVDLATQCLFSQSEVGIFVSLIQHESLCIPLMETLAFWWGLGSGGTECIYPLSTPKGQQEEAVQGLPEVGQKLKFARIIHIDNWALILSASICFSLWCLTWPWEWPANQLASVKMKRLNSERGPEAFLANHPV